MDSLGGFGVVERVPTERWRFEVEGQVLDGETRDEGWKFGEGSGGG